MNNPFKKRHTIFYAFSSVLVVASIGAILTLGIPWGIDFVGGSLMEVTFVENEEGAVVVPSREQLSEVMSSVNIGSFTMQAAGDESVILRFSEVDEETHQQIRQSIDDLEGVALREDRFESVGPVIGQETRDKSVVAVGLVLVMIVVYVAWAFRGVSYPVRSWKYGVVAIIALAHDVIIAVGAISLISHFTHWEIGVPFVAALLTILGYSVNDTIIAFDRIRENITRMGSTTPFENIVWKSIRETLVRSFNTSATTLFVLVAVLLFGGETIQVFVTTLVVGIIVGVYSSIGLAAPLLIDWAKLSHRR